MTWSKVYGKGYKPLGWWYYKILCEFGYWLSFKTPFGIDFGFLGNRIYSRNLNKMVDKYGLNLYGQKYRGR